MTDYLVAKRIWTRLQANLENRGVLRLDDVDDETLEELQVEQVEEILAGLERVK